MKLRLCVLLLCTALLLLLSGCSQTESADSTETSTISAQTISAETAQKKYQKALETLSEESDYTLRITIDKNTTINETFFSEQRRQTLTYRHMGTPDMQASMEETSTIGSQSTAIEEHYANNMAYFSVNGNCFKGAMTAQEYIARYIPAAPLDISLYEHITAQEKDGVVTIQLSQPSKSESWALPDGASMMVASGSVLLDASGALTQSTYDLTYTYGTASVELAATVLIEPNAGNSVEFPADTSGYTKLTYLDGPRLLEQACGYLLQSSLLSADSTSSITSHASGIHRVQSSQLHLHTQDSALSAVLDASAAVTDYSLGGETSYYSQQETFLDGAYHIAINNGTPTADSEITSETMRSYCQDLLVNSILLPEYIKDTSLTDLGSVYLLELTASKELVQLMNEHACQTLYDDPSFLTNLSSASQLYDAECYLAIDKYTGLPTASGIRCSSEYTIEDFVYPFNVQTDTAYSPASLSARTAIYGTYEQTPPTQPTPLFYHVTGEKGQELWLFGTMDVGDSRASALPQAIYDALDASDALAVEYDFETAQARRIADRQLNAELTQASCYINSTTADHLDAQLYETALKLVKASGNYTADTPYLKPVFWESLISQFYLRQGYRLTDEQSVDAQLLQRAKVSKKTILEIEPILQKAQVLGGLSDSLQAAILADTVSCDGLEYHAAMAKLFDLWCAGDKAALQSALADNLSQTPALQEEYTACLSQRNSAMLDAATAHLESKQTVFFAVDVIHLLSEDGLLNTLENAGYTVKQVTFS